jgi:hypothetical protein
MRTVRFLTMTSATISRRLKARAGHGYHGIVMHSSEYIGGALETHIRETPGLWVAVTVETDDDDEQAAGWALAYRAED